MKIRTVVAGLAMLAATWTWAWTGQVKAQNAATATTDATPSARRASDRAAPTFYRTVTTGAVDTTTYSAVPIAPQQVRPGGVSGTGLRDSFVAVQTRHTISGATAQVEVGLYSLVSTGPNVYSFMGIADVQTVSSTARDDGTGFYPLRKAYFPLDGADFYDVRVTAISSGDVDLKAWTVGPATAAAE